MSAEIIDRYTTLAEPREGWYKEKGSKFIAYAYEVEDEEDIRLYLEEVRQLHFKARHHCYAWRLGLDKTHYRANDDGEPSGTAGRPILGQIDSFGLTHCLIVVVRYFGGAKLGTSGLKTAYKAASFEALNEAPTVVRILKQKVKLFLPYPLLSDWMNYLKGADMDIKSSDYAAEEVVLTLSLPLSRLPELQARLDDPLITAIKTEGLEE